MIPRYRNRPGPRWKIVCNKISRPWGWTVLYRLKSESHRSERSLHPRRGRGQEADTIEGVYPTKVEGGRTKTNPSLLLPRHETSPEETSREPLREGTCLCSSTRTTLRMGRWEKTDIFRIRRGSVSWLG